MGFNPFAYQAEFIQMFQENQFTAARWCRQSGKTFIIAALHRYLTMNEPLKEDSQIEPKEMVMQ